MMPAGLTRPVGRALAWMLVGIATAILILGAVHLTVQTRQATQNTNRTAKAVLDCTTPKGECFQRGRRATAKAVGDINLVVVLAAACADKPGDQSQTQIQRCVIRRLSKS